MFHNQLEEKKSQVDHLTERVQFYKEKCLAVEKQSKDEMGWSPYSYAYVSGGCKDPTTLALEKHFTEQMMNQLAAENLRYKIRLAAEEAAKQQLQQHLESLKHELKELRQVHSKFEAQQSIYSSRQQQEQPPPLPPKQQLQQHLDSLEHELKDLRQVHSKFEAQQSIYSSRQQQEQPPPLPPKQHALQIETSQQQKAHDLPPVSPLPSNLPYVGPPTLTASPPQKPTITPRQPRRWIKSPPPVVGSMKPLPKQTQSVS